MLQYTIIILVPDFLCEMYHLSTKINLRAENVPFTTQRVIGIYLNLLQYRASIPSDSL